MRYTYIEETTVDLSWLPILKMSRQELHNWLKLFADNDSDSCNFDNAIDFEEIDLILKIM